jgi:hypothetical protein
VVVDAKLPLKKQLNTDPLTDDSVIVTAMWFQTPATTEFVALDALT